MDSSASNTHTSRRTSNRPSPNTTPTNQSSLHAANVAYQILSLAETRKQIVSFHTSSHYHDLNYTYARFRHLKSSHTFPQIPFLASYHFASFRRSAALHDISATIAMKQPKLSKHPRMTTPMNQRNLASTPVPHHLCLTHRITFPTRLRLSSSIMTFMYQT